LEVAAIGGEDGVGEVVARAYRRLWWFVKSASISFRMAAVWMRLSRDAGSNSAEAKHTIVIEDVVGPASETVLADFASSESAVCGLGGGGLRCGRWSGFGVGLGSASCCCMSSSIRQPGAARCSPAR
jgi:hypothetical protein